MKQITSDEFKKAVDLDPAWASKLTEPVEITDYCDMRKSKITHLSPLLHFTGRDGSGNVANFSKCANLKIAQGTFHGYVEFVESGIEKIDPEKLIITRPDTRKVAASFRSCKNLKVAQGTFPGFVWFNDSGIEKIDPEKLVITQPDNSGGAAIFNSCNNLKIAQGTFPGKVWFDRSGIERIGKLKFKELLLIEYCDHLKSCPATYLDNNSIKMDERLRFQLTQEKKVRDLIKSQPTIEI